jgi:hypothetical protein
MGWFGDALKSVGNATADGLTGGLASGISGEISGIFGGIGAKKRLKRQVDAQKQLNEQAAKLNYEYGEKAAENAYQRQMEMYERSYQDQSYSAMRQQMEDAGLSVGLLQVLIVLVVIFVCQRCAKSFLWLLVCTFLRVRSQIKSNDQGEGKPSL